MVDALTALLESGKEDDSSRRTDAFSLAALPGFGGFESTSDDM